MNAEFPARAPEPGQTFRFGVLAATLFIVSFLHPLLPGGRVGGVVLQVVLSLVMVSAVYVASGSRRLLWLGMAIAAPAIALGWSREVTPDLRLYAASLTLFALLLAYTFTWVVRGVMHRRQVDAQTVLGGVCGYLLLVVLFALLHGLMALAHPGAYRDGSDLLLVWSPEAPSGLADLLYFSVVTVTTLGYGDIGPVGEGARALASAEAMLGQLYLAIFIARLVGLHTAQAGWTTAAEARSPAAGRGAEEEAP